MNQAPALLDVMYAMHQYLQFAIIISKFWIESFLHDKSICFWKCLTDLSPSICWLYTCACALACECMNEYTCESLSVSLSVCCAACLSLHQVYRVQWPALPSTCSLMHSRWSVAVRLRLVLPVPLPAPATDGVNKARPTSSLALCLIRLTRGAPCGSLGSA